VTRIKLDYVHAWVDKRRGGAKPRYYFRRPGFKRVPLPGLPGSAEFMAAYEAALTGQTAPRLPIGAGRVRAGTIGALALAYFNSPMFLALAAITKRSYRSIIEAFTREHGDKPLALIEEKHIKGMLARKVATPAAANNWLQLVKILMRFAVEEGMRKDNPAIGVRRIRRQSDGFHTWTEEEIAQFEAHHPIGSMARLAFGLLLYTAQRRSDVIRMGRQHVQNGKARVRQQKTRAELTIRVHPDLQAILSATPSEHLTFIVTEQGKPYTPMRFTHWFRGCCDAAGLPKRCKAHGLRKAACRRLAEAGCSEKVIAAISGHATLAEVQRYTKAADQERLADAGIAAIISRTSSGNRS
jgi:integrase